MTLTAAGAPSIAMPGEEVRRPLATLRERLRAETASQHDNVDRAYSQLDLCEKASLVRFFQAQGIALRAIHCRPGTNARDAEALRDEMIGAIEGDLRHLGASWPDALEPVELDATAVHYVLLGSQMGMRVLRQRWAAANDPAVAGAGRTFSLPLHTLAWRHFCNEVAARPADDPAADILVSDAGRVFGLYLAALKLTVDPRGFPPVSDQKALQNPPGCASGQCKRNVP